MAQIVFSRWYATMGTWPDICFAVQTISRFNTNPGSALGGGEMDFSLLEGNQRFMVEPVVIDMGTGKVSNTHGHTHTHTHHGGYTLLFYIRISII